MENNGLEHGSQQGSAGRDLQQRSQRGFSRRGLQRGSKQTLQQEPRRIRGTNVVDCEGQGFQSGTQDAQGMQQES